eukprot:scaffold35712_cov90-Isochrysis_galbana.AAC.1
MSSCSSAAVMDGARSMVLGGGGRAAKEGGAPFGREAAEAGAGPGKEESGGRAAPIPPACEDGRRVLTARSDALEDGGGVGAREEGGSHSRGEGLLARGVRPHLEELAGGGRELLREGK